MLRNFTQPYAIVKLKFHKLVYSCIVTFLNKIKVQHKNQAKLATWLTILSEAKITQSDLFQLNNRIFDDMKCCLQQYQPFALIAPKSFALPPLFPSHLKNPSKPKVIFSAATNYWYTPASYPLPQGAFVNFLFSHKSIILFW